MLSLDNLFARSVTNSADAQSRVVRHKVRSLLLLAFGTVLLVSADLSGVPSLRAYGPYALFGLLLPGNIASCAILTYAMCAERNTWWRVPIAISFFVSLISLSLVGLLILGHLLFMNFPGPG